MAKKLFSTAEAASAAGISRQTLQTWIIEGKIKPPEMIGNMRVWTESDIAELRQLPRGRWPKPKPK